MISGSFFSDRGVGQSAAFAKSEDAGGESDFAHWDGDDVAATFGQREDTKAGCDGVAVGGDFDDVALTTAKAAQNGV